MKNTLFAILLVFLPLFLYVPAACVKEENLFFSSLKRHLKLSENEISEVKNIFNTSKYIGQGNTKITKHPMSRQECKNKLKETNTQYENKTHESVCKSPYMSPIYDPSNQKPEEAKVCIDKFEFPNIPCEYPVIWVKASEAALICKAIGKRLCDAHEWEGACAGEAPNPDYPFSLIKPNMTVSQKHNLFRNYHNKKRKVKWSYGKEQNHLICGTNSTKTDECNKALSTGKSVYETCGSNTYPAGAFPECKSTTEVYDIHGNAAEHMNLPFSPDELTGKGGTGYTEMKGSWFIFAKFSAHKDDCHFRAPFWHGTKVMSEKSHRNYHLGFRCCKDIL